MVVRNLEYLYDTCPQKCITGAAATSAKAMARGTSAFATATAVGDSVRVKTETYVSAVSGRYIDYSIAYASARAVAQTGYKYSVSVDYAVDANVSVRR
jgi:hypothetical protein